MLGRGCIEAPAVGMHQMPVAEPVRSGSAPTAGMHVSSPNTNPDKNGFRKKIWACPRIGIRLSGSGVPLIAKIATG